jgi:hypothetical protein
LKRKEILKVKKHYNYGAYFENAAKSGYGSSSNDFESLAQYLQNVIEAQPIQESKTTPNVPDKLCNARIILGSIDLEDDTKNGHIHHKRPVTKVNDSSWINVLRLRVEKALHRYILIVY